MHAEPAQEQRQQTCRHMILFADRGGGVGLLIPVLRLLAVRVLRRHGPVARLRAIRLLGRLRLRLRLRVRRPLLGRGVRLGRLLGAGLRYIGLTLHLLRIRLPSGSRLSRLLGLRLRAKRRRLSRLSGIRHLLRLRVRLRLRLGHLRGSRRLRGLRVRLRLLGRRAQTRRVKAFLRGLQLRLGGGQLVGCAAFVHRIHGVSLTFSYPTSRPRPLAARGRSRIPPRPRPAPRV